MRLRSLYLLIWVRDRCSLFLDFSEFILSLEIVGLSLRGKSAK